MTSESENIAKDLWSLDDSFCLLFFFPSPSKVWFRNGSGVTRQVSMKKFQLSSFALPNVASWLEHIWQKFSVSGQRCFILLSTTSIYFNLFSMNRRGIGQRSRNGNCRILAAQWHAHNERLALTTTTRTTSSLDGRLISSSSTVGLLYISAETLSSLRHGNNLIIC